MSAFALSPQERVAQRRRAQLSGLVKAAEARRAIKARRSGASTGWYAGPDWRLNAIEAGAAATLLEAHGWRAEACPLAQGIALVEVRDLAVRGHPLIATLRAPGEAERWLREHGEGFKGRVPSPPEGVTR